MTAQCDHLDLRDDLTAEYFPPIEGATPETPGTYWGDVGYDSKCVVPFETWVAADHGTAVGLLAVHVCRTVPTDRGHEEHAVVQVVASRNGSGSGPFLVCTAIRQLEEKGLRLYRSGDASRAGYHLLKEKLNLLVDPNRTYDEAKAEGAEPDYEADRGPIFAGRTEKLNEIQVLSNLDTANELLAYRLGTTRPSV